MKKILFLVLFILTASSSVKAETLQDVLTEAYYNNPQILSARAQTRATDEDVSLAQSGWRPNINITGEYAWAESKTNVETPAGTQTTNVDHKPHSVSLNVSQPIFRGFQTIYNTRAAKNASKAQRSFLEKATADILTQITKIYIQVLFTENVLELREKSHDLIQQQLDAVAARYAAGTASHTDVLQAEARFSQAQASLLQAHANVEASRAAYKNIMKKDPINLMEPELNFSAIPATFDEFMTHVKEDNPSVQTAEFSFKASRDQVGSARGEMLPSVSLTASKSRAWDTISSYSFSGTPTGDDVTDSEQIAIQATIPLYQAGAAASKLRKAKQNSYAKENDFIQAQRSAIEDGTQTWHTLEALKASQEAIEKQVFATEIALEGMQAQERYGKKSILDVLDYEQELLNAKIDLMQNKQDTILTSLQALSLMGQFSLEKLNISVKPYDSEKHYKHVNHKWIGTRAKTFEPKDEKDD